MTLPAHARVVVIGGGIVGCSVLYHLAKRGWRDIVLLERGELTSGSTWHAAGNTPHFSTSLNLSRMHRYGTELLPGLEAATGQGVGFHRTGSLRLASVPERMDEYRFHRAKARTIGVNFEIVGPDEIRRLHPLASVEGVLGAAWNPDDGHVDPSGVTQALAKGARDAGAAVLRNTRVVGVKRLPSGEWRVATEVGEIVAAAVVNAAGTWAREIGAMSGLDLPIVPIEHQYLVFDAMPEVMALDRELPILREVDVSYYLRQERQGLLLGPYERQATPFGARGIPANFGADLLPPDLDRLETIVEGAFRRVPALAGAGMKRVVNGPITYTPDGNPLLGPAPALPGMYLACGFSFGITQGAGAGKWLADLIVDGAPAFDLFELDPRRYGRYATLDWTIARCQDIYADEYAIGFPYLERPVGRNARTAPVHARLAAKGAVFGSRRGWERPQWFARAEEAAADRPSFRRSNWFEPVNREARRVRAQGGIVDLTSFSKFEISGPHAPALLDRLVANRLPRRAGGIVLAHMLTPAGGIRSEVTITRTGEHAYFLASAAAAEQYDLDWIGEHRRPEEFLSIDNVTEAWGCLALAGPHARDVLAKLCPDDLSAGAWPWRTMRAITVAGMPVRALRLSYTGEAGWELFHPIDRQGALYDALVEAGAPLGVGDFGWRALDALRLEKGYRSWGADINVEVTPFEAGFARFVDLQKEFIGREALLRQGTEGIRKRIATLEVVATDTDARGNEPVFAGDKVVGITSSGGYGAWIEKSLALAYLDVAHAAIGTELTVELMSERRPARVIADCPYDPENRRPRA